MKKSLMLLAATAALTVSSAAMAIQVQQPLDLRVDGLGQSLGTIEFTALGRYANQCQYLMTWENPYNPNDVSMCFVHERRTPIFPSCIHNRDANITTFVQAGPGSAAGTSCSGFDNLGIGYDHDVTLLLGEYAAAPFLQGVAIFPTYLAYPVIAG